MSKFKVGDRVAVYHRANREVGTVKDILNTGTLTVLIDDKWFYRHEKQCRKLVKKKRREFWLYRHSNIELFTATIYKPSDKYFEVIKVREVKDAAQELPKETKSK